MTVKVTSVLCCSNRTYIHFVTDNDVKHSVPSEWTDYYTIERHPADWDQYGRSAGMIRNREMAKAADSLIAFWDGKSKGTANMIQTSEKMGLAVKVVRYEK